jgi:uncharacterized membrane protein YhaH (DUF805 family)
MATFKEAINTTILQKYLDFSGRATRSEYWYFVLFYFLCAFIAGILDGILGLGVFSIIAVFGLLLPSLAVAVRRLHDTGKSGWWMLIGIVPLAFIVLLVFFCQKSDEAENAYGPRPIS